MAVKLGDPVEKSYGRDDINDRYHRYDKILGRGAYKTVFWGWDTSDGVDVAWNCIDLDALPSAEERRKISREVEMLQQLKHKHILRIRDHWENPHTNQLCFITDILQGGSLREYIRQREVNLGRVKSWCIQILDALNYLHSRTPVIIHRDLKCDNIFIDGPTGNITIGDLGLSTQYSNRDSLGQSLSMNNAKGMSIVGTPEFMAPELYEEKYDEKVDIYAFGMCVVEMVSKKYPYEECSNQMQVIRKVTEKKQPDILRKLHRYVRTFIEICIARDASKRPSASELLEHPFLAYMDDLKNRMCVSNFVGNRDRIALSFQQMEIEERNRQTNLSTIEERNRQTSHSPSPKQQNQNIATRTVKKKRKYVSHTTVSMDESGQISVKLKINRDKESQKVKFTYNPHKEKISMVVREMVETLELDQTREQEIVNSIASKLNDLNTTVTNTKPNSSSIPPQAIHSTHATPVLSFVNTASHTTHEFTQLTATPHTQKVTSPQRYPNQRAATQPPNLNINSGNNPRKEPYSEPPSANTQSTNANPIFYEGITGMQNVHFPPKMYSNGGHNLHINAPNGGNTSMHQSEPCTPSHSPPTEKQKYNGYMSDSTPMITGPPSQTVVSNSLLDQIMALPRDTIKARIKQFGGTVNDEEETRILVTKLFQLLSSSNSGNRRESDQNTNANANANTNTNTKLVPLNNVRVQNSIPTELEEASDTNDSVILNSAIPQSGSIQHVQSHPSLQLLNVNNLGNLTGNKSGNNSTYHSEMGSIAQSMHTTPPTKIPLGNVSKNVNINVNANVNANRQNITSNIAISPQNELVYQQRQLSQESIKSNASYHSVHSHTQSHSQSHSTQHSQESPKSINTNAVLSPQIIDDGSDDEEIDPSIEIPKLRIKQKELMQGKIRYEMQRLKQRNDTQLGRDKTLDNIALQLDGVGKQIKLLTDAAKSGVKVHKNKKAINREYSYHSDKDSTDHTTKKVMKPHTTHARTNSNESNKSNKIPQSSPDKSPKNLIPIPQSNNLTISHNVTANASMNNTQMNSRNGSADRSLLVDTSESIDMSQVPKHISSPLVSRTKREEFEHYVKELPEVLDLTQIGFNRENLKNVPFSTSQHAENRIIKEKRQLEEEYNQYYADQTEMLLLKLQKHKHNPSKCKSETQSTANKLKCKQDKQRNKFKSIVDDQVQILQLTQELNENELDGIDELNSINENEWYVYKDSMEHTYLERVKEFEIKQKKELDAFRHDLHHLKQLKLEVYKKKCSRSNQSSPKPMHNHRRVSPPIKTNINIGHTHSNNSAFQLQQNSLPNMHAQTMHIKSSSTPTLPLQQIDILTGAMDTEPLIEESQTNNNPFRPVHYHSASLPLLSDSINPHNIATHTHTHTNKSKFKVSEVRDTQSRDPYYSHQNRSTNHNHSNSNNHSLNSSFEKQ